MSSLYYTPHFAALRAVHDKVVQRAGRLMFDIATGVLDAETLGDLIAGAYNRKDTDEVAALLLVTSALSNMKELGNAPS